MQVDTNWGGAFVSASQEETIPLHLARIERHWGRYGRDMDKSGTKVFSISSPMLPKRKSVSDLGVNTSLQTGKGIYFNGEINFMSKEKGWD